MTAQFPNLATVAPKPYRFAQFMRLPGDPVTSQIVEFPALTMEVRKFLSMQQAKNTRNEAARTLVVAGGSGAGKSEGTLVAALNEGYTVMSTPASMYASENEGGATQLLDEVLAECERWSAENQRPIVLKLEDIDLSIMAQDDKTGVSSNTSLLIEKFHHLSDNRHLFRNFDGSNIGFIVTLNDSTRLRETLFRQGRAIVYEHAPTVEDKRNIAWKVLDPRTTKERHLVEKLTRKFKHQPVAFWKALKFEIQATHAKRVLTNGIPDSAILDAAFTSRCPLTPEIVWPAAKKLRANRVRNWLTRRGLFKRR